MPTALAHKHFWKSRKHVCFHHQKLLHAPRTTQRSGVLTELWTAPVVRCSVGSDPCVSLWNGITKQDHLSQMLLFLTWKTNQPEGKLRRKSQDYLRPEWVTWGGRGSACWMASAPCPPGRDYNKKSLRKNEKKIHFFGYVSTGSQNIKKINNNKKESRFTCHSCSSELTEFTFMLTFNLLTFENDKNLKQILNSVSPLRIVGVFSLSSLKKKKKFNTKIMWLFYGKKKMYWDF